MVDQRRKREFFLISSFRCYWFESSCNDWIIFSLPTEIWQAPPKVNRMCRIRRGNDLLGQVVIGQGGAEAASLIMSAPGDRPCLSRMHLNWLNVRNKTAPAWKIKACNSIEVQKISSMGSFM
jgi:hypothetical protein